MAHSINPGHKDGWQHQPRPRRWLIVPTQATEMAHSTNLGHGMASDQAAGAGKHIAWYVPSSNASPWLSFCPGPSSPQCVQLSRDHKSIHEVLPGMGSPEVWQRPPHSLKWRPASREAWHRRLWDLWGLNLGICMMLARHWMCCDAAACIAPVRSPVVLSWTES